MHLSRPQQLTRRTHSAKPFQPARSNGQRNVTTNAIKLYTNPGSRGKMPEWYLAELGLSYEPVVLNMKAGDHKKPEFLAINPFGKVPAMEDDGVKIFESGAILLYLATKYAKLSMVDMAAALQWTMFANSTMSDAFFNERARATQMGPLLAALDNILSKQAWVAGPEFSVSDVAVGAYILYVPMFFPDYDFSKVPHVLKYMRALAARPACPEAYKQVMQGR